MPGLRLLDPTTALPLGIAHPDARTLRHVALLSVRPGPAAVLWENPDAGWCDVLGYAESAADALDASVVLNSHHNVPGERFVAVTAEAIPAGAWKP